MRRAVELALALTALAMGAGIALAAGAFRSPGPSGSGPGAPPPATRAVVREDLSSQVPVQATLGYAGSYTVRGQGGGTLTWLPSAGQVIGQGQALYRLDNADPVVLLYGTGPAWRALDEGLSGADVDQLNHDLVTLGYAAGSDVGALGWDYYSWETASGVERLESALGVSSPPGSLPLGSVAFEPGAALLAQAPAGYAVEVVGAGGTRRLVPVTAGIFDDESGLVQVTGALTQGELVVVPAA